MYREGHEVNLEIQDFGIGIDKSDQKHILKDFIGWIKQEVEIQVVQV